MGMKITLDGQLSTGITTKILPVDGAKIEIQQEAEVAYTTGVQLKTIVHNKEGYNCYLLHCPQYGIEEDFFVYIWDVGTNQATLRIVNQGAAVTRSIGTTVWLCIPIIVDEATESDYYNP